MIFRPRAYSSPSGHCELGGINEGPESPDVVGNVSPTFGLKSFYPFVKVQQRHRSAGINETFRSGRRIWNRTIGGGVE